MESQAIAGIGTLFRRWDGANWVNIAEIINLAGPSMTRNTIPVVTLDSIDGYIEYLSGFRDGGNLTFTMIFRRDTYQIALTDFESDTLQNYELYFPQDDEDTSIEFEGLVTEMPLTVPAEEKMTVDVTIKISGRPTLNSGSGSSA